MAGEFQSRPLESLEPGEAGRSADPLVRGEGDQGHSEIPTFDGGGDGPP
jgi:hypothetical protein